MLAFVARTFVFEKLKLSSVCDVAKSIVTGCPWDPWSSSHASSKAPSLVACTRAM